MRHNKGSVLITAYAILLLLTLFGGIFFMRTISERKLYDIDQERLEAFYLAEAGVDRALAELRAGFQTYSGTGSPVSFGKGQYEITVASVSGSLTRKTVTATGYIPSKASPRARREIEAVVKKETPPDFFKHAIYSAGDINLIGNKYKVEGDANGYSDILYADSLNWDVSKDGVESNPPDVDADEQQDASIKPLARLEFEILRNLAIAQGNYYDADRIKDVETSKDSYPNCGSCSDCPGLPEGADCCFWHSCPTDPLDPSTGVPKVVYVEGDLVLNGNIGEIGGFFVVVGNVLTDPEDTGDSTINGNGDVRGCIYSTGKFNINGGGGDLNVDGGVWAGSEAEMKGSSNLYYNATFMEAIKAMIEREGVGPAVQIVSWREIE